MNGQIAGFLVIYGIALCIARKLCDKFFNRMPKGRITMTLKDTAKLMVSDDYKDRFKAEYFQLKIRHDKLCAMLNKWDARTLEFAPTCPRNLYDGQMRAMRWYLCVLENRARLEGVNLEGEGDNG